ncbi:MAG: cation diffusion facilitator family transporter [Deltaproteobacteria bacterium]|nr:cation diffusion facilitator family transporter [Deltaproteobacteria bacterium]
MSGGADSRKVVIAALAGNLAIATCKFGAAFLSGSTATLAEAVHSVADTGNQGLLLVGMRLAARPADDRFPFGRSGEKYFWPFVVALMLFSVGGAFAVYDGVSHVVHPHAEEHGSRIWSYGVLGVSLVFEAMSFRVAWKEFQVLAKGKPWIVAVREARDPTIPLVLAEDTTALIGLAIAFFAVLASHVTGQPFWDPVGSILIGVLLAVVAVALARNTHTLLVGASADPEEQGHALALTEATPGIERVTQILTFHVGPDVVILAMKVAFAKDLDAAKIEETINEAERRIRAELPLMRKIFIEVDANGDGRGVERARQAWAARQRDSQKEFGPHGPKDAEKEPAT